MPIETRYFVNRTVTVNGLTAWDLGLYLAGAYNVRGILARGSAATTGSIGIRVWKRTVGGVETEITAGAPVAVATRTGNGGPEPAISGTWPCPATPLVSTDSVVVRVYGRYDADAWVLFTEGTFTTEQLGAQSLDAATWTVYYHLLTFDFGFNAAMSFYWDGDFETLYFYPSSIGNFTYTLYVPPVVGAPPFRLIHRGIMVHIG